MPKVALFRILAEECRYLRLEFRVAESLWITLDPLECDFAAKFVFAHKVNLLVPLPVPPRAHLGVRRRLRELPVKVAFQRVTAEHIEIPQCNLAQIVGHSILDEIQAVRLGNRLLAVCMEKNDIIFSARPDAGEKTRVQEKRQKRRKLAEDVGHGH